MGAALRENRISLFGGSRRSRPPGATINGSSDHLQFFDLEAGRGQHSVDQWQMSRADNIGKQEFASTPQDTIGFPRETQFINNLRLRRRTEQGAADPSRCEVNPNIIGTAIAIDISVGSINLAA